MALKIKFRNCLLLAALLVVVPFAAADFCEVDDYRIPDKGPNLYLKKVKHFKKWFNCMIPGQPQVTNTLFRSLAVLATGLQNPDRPAGVFLFIGDNSLKNSQWKKRISSLFSEYLFGKNKLKRLNLRRVAKAHEIGGLFGTPCGYAGCYPPGRLWSWADKNPSSTIVFSNLQYTHKRALESLMPILENAKIKGNQAFKPVKINKSFVFLEVDIGQGILDHQRKNKVKAGSKACVEYPDYYVKYPENFLKDDCYLDRRELRTLLMTDFLQNTRNNVGTFLAGRVGRYNMIYLQ